jgi:hypothetical protein
VKKEKKNPQVTLLLDAHPIFHYFDRGLCHSSYLEVPTGRALDNEIIEGHHPFRFEKIPK